MSKLNRCWVLAESDQGAGIEGMSLRREHFKRDDRSIPIPGNAEVLIQSLYFATDPMNHAWVRGVPGRFDPIPVGQPLRGGVAGKIVESNNPAWSPGDIVTGFLEWADFNVSAGTDLLGMPLQVVPRSIDPASGLGALGMTGICAMLSLTEFGNPIPGDTVVVSGASGAIGSIACQIARLFGARVVGLARGDDKCTFVRSLGVDIAIDITDAAWGDQLAAACPEGIHVFVDNVGGHVLDNVLLNVAHGARIIVCGATAHYESGASISNHLMLAIHGCSMHGFFYFDHVHQWQNCRSRLAHWLGSGEIRDTLDISSGFDAAPEAALGQFTGANFGRRLIHVDAGR